MRKTTFAQERWLYVRWVLVTAKFNTLYVKVGHPSGKLPVPVSVAFYIVDFTEFLQGIETNVCV